MVVYADNDFYMNEYLCGKKAVIDTASFSFYARKATQTIKQYTLDNVPVDIPECVKMCCCEIAEAIYKDEETANKHSGVTSERVGNWSKSYESTEQAMQVMQKNIKSIVYKWLSGTGLLYRGVYK